ncbi:hypothetical protein NOSIN_19240 [Nocardiopsis sinuspersici]|uniref:CD225/dispanin family protein n=1 Tax=Nocardiopsis sinuspersici TaxID=501010 RepID=A0A1V3C959_9ACTN|nr:hypothetical protein NOSIN_19240 [Nocardiopsis sinuspersici]
MPPHGHGTGPYHPCPGCPPPCSHPPVPRPGFPRQAEPQNLAGPILALSLSILLMVTCCGALGVVGTVFSSLALSERTDPERFRRYTRNAWIANGVVLGLMLVFVVFVVTGSS